MNKDYLSIFHSKDEEYIAGLGNGYLSSILSGQGLSQTALILSNKRLYQIGKIYELTKNGNGFTFHNGRKVVDIEDVTSVSYKSIMLPAILFMGISITVLIYMISFISEEKSIKLIFSLLGFVAVAISFSLYIFKKQQFLFIEYSGGSIAVPTKFYTTGELNDFQQVISIQKDTLKSGFKEFKECPFCAEKIQIKAKVCRYCGKELEK